MKARAVAASLVLAACGTSEPGIIAPFPDVPRGGDDAAAPVADAGIAEAAAPAPPPTWQEHWFEHEQLVTAKASDEHVSVYMDADVDTTQAAWVLPFVSSIWQYTKRTYGDFAPDNRLYVVLHATRYPGCHAATHFDDHHDHRSVVDCGADDWNAPTAKLLDATTREIGNIVQLSSYGHRGSPGLPIFQAKWSEIFIFDAYRGIARNTEAARVHTELTDVAHTDSFPVEGAHWFRDWYHPIWKDFGGAATLSRYFSLLAAYFPNDSANAYQRPLDWGEYVHFMSGAARKDLKPLATAAFGWPPAWETQYQAARTTFSDIRY